MTDTPFLLACSLIVLAIVPLTAIAAWRRSHRGPREYRRWTKRKP